MSEFSSFIRLIKIYAFYCSSIPEAEAEGTPIQGQCGLHSKTLSQKKQQQNQPKKKKKKFPRIVCI
jgi:hypothetical protein